jgi:beta-lactamase class A
MKKTATTGTSTGTRNKPRRLPLIITGVIAGIMAVTFLFSAYFPKRKAIPEDSVPAAPEKEASIKLLREDGKTLIRPLLLVMVGEESDKYASLKESLTAVIHHWQQKNIVRNVSVYLKDLSDATWMGIDYNQTYMPGSLIKVPIMIYFLKQEEKHPGTLNKSLVFEKPRHYFPAQEFKGDSIIPGRSYKISELLRYMIVESDNNATNLLSRELDPDQFKKIFSDLEIVPDEINDVNYVISPRDYSRFFRVLYNATYLNQELSEYGLRLLAGCKFSEGIAKNIPAGTIVARKFGERGINEVIDFSESAIVFKGKTPYSLTIMTKGTSAKQQTELISEISDIVYKSFQDN